MWSSARTAGVAVGSPSEDGDLARHVHACQVIPRVGLGVAQRLGLGHHVAEGTVGCRQVGAAAAMRARREEKQRLERGVEGGASVWPCTLQREQERTWDVARPASSRRTCMSMCCPASQGTEEGPSVRRRAVAPARCGSMRVASDPASMAAACTRRRAGAPTSKGVENVGQGAREDALDAVDAVARADQVLQRGNDGQARAHGALQGGGKAVQGQGLNRLGSGRGSAPARAMAMAADRLLPGSVVMPLIH